MVSVDEFPISTANDIPGFRIIETKGFVYGLTVRSRGFGGQVQHARELGANAVIAARYDSNEISGEMQEILVYGTAVVAEKIE